MWQLITACSLGSVSTHADGEQTITTQLAVPKCAVVGEVLNYVSMVHAGLPWIGLKKQLDDGWDMYNFHTLDGISVVTCEKNTDIGYLYRDGSDEFAWFMDAEGDRQTSGWTPFPLPMGLMPHVQVNVSSETYGVAFAVDEGLGPIMQVLLDRGIYTEHSCACYRLTSHPLRVFLPTSMSLIFEKEQPVDPTLNGCGVSPPPNSPVNLVSQSMAKAPAGGA